MGDTYHALFYHYLWSTKHRVPSMTKDVRERVYPYIGGIVRNLDCSMLAIVGVEDHVHVLTKLTPSIAPRDAARTIKANSSRFIHDTFPALRSFDWQDGYTVFSVSRSGIPAVEKYLRDQEKHHRKVSFIDELKMFLEKHGVEFKPEFLL